MLLRFLANYRWEILLVAGMHAPTWGFWVLSVSGPLELRGLAFDLVWWSVVIVIPALVMAVLYIRLRRRGYGWGLRGQAPQGTGPARSRRACSHWSRCKGHRPDAPQVAGVEEG